MFDSLIKIPTISSSNALGVAYSLYKNLLKKLKTKISKICDRKIFLVVISKHKNNVLLNLNWMTKAYFSSQNLTCGEVC